MSFSEEISQYIRQKHYRQINSVLFWQDGEILAENYYNGFTAQSRNVLRSVVKSILSLAVGAALEHGLLPGLDVAVADYLPPFREGRDPLHPLITVWHLLTMTSGIYWNGGVHYHCPMMAQLWRSGNWLSHIADCAVADLPGMRHNYKEFDVILLTAVLEAVCGDLYDFIDREIYTPLGIRSQRWYKSPCGIYYSVGGGREEDELTSALTAREMLQLGRLCLDGGVYDGRRIVSESYLREALAPSAADPNYGFLFWLGDGWYACRGYGGQRIHVFPEKRLIAVMQATPTSRGMAYDDVIHYGEQICSSYNSNMRRGGQYSFGL